MSDLIDRQKLIDELPQNSTEQMSAYQVGLLILRQPAIQQERTAEKIEQEPIGMSKIKSAKCSICGVVVIIGAVYCWTCGAKFTIQEAHNE